MSGIIIPGRPNPVLYRCVTRNCPQTIAIEWQANRDPEHLRNAFRAYGWTLQPCSVPRLGAPSLHGFAPLCRGCTAKSRAIEAV